MTDTQRRTRLTTALAVAGLVGSSLAVGACLSLDVLLPDAAEDAATSQPDGSIGHDGASVTEASTPDDASGDDAPAGDGGAGTCDAELERDPENCGSCGHSCLGGQCGDGACAPIELPGVQASALVAANGALYFIGSGSTDISRFDLQASSVAKLHSGSGVAALAVDGSYLYWATVDVDDAGSTIMRAFLDGGSSNPVTKQQPQVSSIATNGAAVFWATTVAGGGIFARAVDGGRDEIVGLAFPLDVHASSTHVAWVEGSAGDNTVGAATIGDLSKGVNYGSISGHQNGSLALTENGVYWGDTNGPGEIYFDDFMNGQQPVVDAQASLTGITADDGGVYWITNGPDGGVYRCTTLSCSDQVAPIAALPTGGSDPVLDATSIYWIDNQGNVYRLAR